MASSELVKACQAQDLEGVSKSLKNGADVNSRSQVRLCTGLLSVLLLRGLGFGLLVFVGLTCGIPSAPSCKRGLRSSPHAAGPRAAKLCLKECCMSYVHEATQMCRLAAGWCDTACPCGQGEKLRFGQGTSRRWGRRQLGSSGARRLLRHWLQCAVAAMYGCKLPAHSIKALESHPP